MCIPLQGFDTPKLLNLCLLGQLVLLLPRGYRSTMDYSAIGQYTFSSVVRQFWGRAARNVLQEAILAGRFVLPGLSLMLTAAFQAAALKSLLRWYPQRLGIFTRNSPEHPVFRNCTK